ncbi:unnamed protein product [Discosporangium mesarthrocarpum]
MERAWRRREKLLEEEEAKAATEERRRRVAGGKWAEVGPDRGRLMRATKASRERELDPETLDDLQEERASRPAHSSKIPNSGRDLRFQGRAVPSWCAGVLGR